MNNDNWVSEVSQLLSILKDMKADVKIVIFTDQSGHVEEGFLGNTKISESFLGIQEVPLVLAKILEKKEQRKKLTENIFSRFFNKNK
jgi:hypothetical protein